jgi:beta-glucosidase
MKLNRKNNAPGLKTGMNFGKGCLMIALSALVLQCTSTSSITQDPAEKLANEKLAKMTLEEKVSLCRGNSTFSINAIPRVGINDELTMDDGPHNVRPETARGSFASAGADNDYSTSLPTLTALAATWDTNDATQFGNVIGEEARDRGKDIMLGPGVNIMRTPLNGRNFEYMGEDPALASAMVVPEICAMQSHDVAACVKHFVLNNQELNRGDVNVEVDERTLREIYLPAFHAAVVDGEVLSVMNAYNRFRGVHCSENAYLNLDILKGEWGFKGLVVSDWGGVHSTVNAALNGLDVEMDAGNNIRYFKQPLIDAVREGKVPEQVVDDKARRVLYVMSRLHMLDGVSRQHGSINTPEHQAIARKIAEDAIVLLKNDGNLLPLDKSTVKTLLVVGDNAIRKHCTEGGSAMGKPPYEITPLEGLHNLLGDGVKIEYVPVPGAGMLTPIPASCLAEGNAVSVAGTKSWTVNFFNNTKLQDTPAITRYDSQPSIHCNGQSPAAGVNPDNFSARYTVSVVAPETGDYRVGFTCDDGARLFINDKLIIDSWSDGAKRSKSTIVNLQAGKTYRFRAEYFQASGDAVFSVGWQTPSSKSAPFASLLAKAKAADAVILFTGDNHDIEQEGIDRSDIMLPAGQDDMVKALLPTNSKTVVVNLSGAPVAMPWVEDARAIVQYWFSGMEGGNALSRVLFGEVNPSGKLPFTFPVKLADSPAHFLGNYNPDSVNYAEGVFVGYRWFDARNITPLFPFGYGLSYTTFEIGDPELSAQEINNEGSVTVKVKVTNTGKRAGAEVVQLYVAEEKPSVPRPPKELKSFRKVFLQPGESQTVELPVTTHDLAFWDVTTHDWKTNAGKFDLLIGNSSRNIMQELLLTVK